MTAIADYALLGDWCCTGVSERRGRLVVPSAVRQPSAFTRLLDAPAGHWSIRPASGFSVTRGYVVGTLVVQTEFTTASGAVRRTGSLAFGPGERGHQIGDASPRVLVRHVEALHGEVKAALDLVTRLEYGWSPHCSPPRRWESSSETRPGG
jgi:hypothetical protein